MFVTLLKKYTLFFLFVGISSISYAQLFTQYATPANLDSMVQANFGNPNVEILNVNFTGYQYVSFIMWGNAFNENTYDYYDSQNDTIRDIGYFDATQSTVGIDSGIIITGGLLEAPYGLGKKAYFNT